jgi:hypothetical protein
VHPKNNENRVFPVKEPESPRKIDRYFRGLDRKFVTPRINRIFSKDQRIQLA